MVAPSPPVGQSFRILTKGRKRKGNTMQEIRGREEAEGIEVLGENHHHIMAPLSSSHTPHRGAEVGSA